MKIFGFQSLKFIHQSDFIYFQHRPSHTWRWVTEKSDLEKVWLLFYMTCRHEIKRHVQRVVEGLSHGRFFTRNEGIYGVTGILSPSTSDDAHKANRKNVSKNMTMKAWWWCRWWTPSLLSTLLIAVWNTSEVHQKKKENCLFCVYFTPSGWRR